MGWIIFMIIVEIAFLVWMGFSFKIVGPDEMAVKVIFGNPIAFCKSGWVFDLRFPLPRYFKCFLQRYPQKMYNFDFKEREVITQAGNYRGAGGQEETYYGSQTLKVNSVVYLNFPREKRGKETTGDDLIDVETVEEEVEIGGMKKKVEVEKTHPLIKILRAQVPITPDKNLQDWTEEAVLGALRVAFGKMTWMQAVEDIKKVTQEAVDVFTKADGALIRAGFSKKGIQLVIAEIKLPKKLEEAMPKVDQQRLEARAAPFEAEQRAAETVGTIIAMMAKARGKKPEDIAAEIEKSDELKNEFLDLSKDLIVREMGIKRGAYLDIRTVSGEPGKTLLDLIAAWKRMPGGGKEEREKPKKAKKMKKVQAFGVTAEVPEEEEEEEE